MSSAATPMTANTGATRTFRAPDARTALAAVKEALGTDAIIVSTRQVPGGLFRRAMVEVVAAPAAPPAPARPVNPAAVASGLVASGPVAPLTPPIRPPAGLPAAYANRPRAEAVLRAPAAGIAPNPLLSASPGAAGNSLARLAPGPARGALPGLGAVGLTPTGSALAGSTQGRSGLGNLPANLRVPGAGLQQPGPSSPSDLAPAGLPATDPASDPLIDDDPADIRSAMVAAGHNPARVARPHWSETVDSTPPPASRPPAPANPPAAVNPVAPLAATAGAGARTIAPAPSMVPPTALPPTPAPAAAAQTPAQPTPMFPAATTGSVSSAASLGQPPPGSPSALPQSAVASVSMDPPASASGAGPTPFPTTRPPVDESRDDFGRGGTARRGRHWRRGGPADNLARRYDEQGVDSRLAEEWIQEALEAGAVDENALDRAVRSLAANRLKTAPPPWTRTGERQVISLVGPTGVGKTTTLAKIAARAILDSRIRVALVTTDTYRICASDQLARYGQIMRTPTFVARDGSQLLTALDQARDFDLVLIDTAGRAIQADLEKQVSMLRQAGVLRLYLTLSLASGPRELVANCRRYGALDPARVILTKVDESVAPGAALGPLIELGRPVTCLTNGQEVPEDVKLATPESMLSLLLGSPLSAGASDGVTVTAGE